MKSKKYYKLIVAADGSAASGKTTGARLISKKYGLQFLSSGLLYRYASYHLLKSKPKKTIQFLKKKFNFKVIEDSSHALGGSYLGKKIGNCEYSHMSVFSFHPVKMITTGEGGAITTNSKTLDDKVSLLRTHGITKEDKKFHNKPHGSWYYEQQVLGFNYRLTEIQAALGISQLKR